MNICVIIKSNTAITSKERMFLMKNRLVAVILSLILIFSSASVLANADNFMLGDVDGNEKLTAMDARLVLRAAARIDILTEEQFTAADVTFDSKVTAMDARTILRAAARIEDLPELPAEDTSETESTETTTAETPTETTTAETTTEEPDTGVVVTEYPEAISAFFKGTFYLNAKMGDDGEVTNIKMATNKSGTEIVMDSASGVLSLYATKSSSFIKLITPEEKKYYVELTKAMMDSYGIDFSQALGDFSFLAVENPGDPVLTTEEYDGKDCSVYTFAKEDSSAMKFYTVGEDVVKIAVQEKDGTNSTVIFVEELSGSIPKTMLTTKGFTKTSIIMLGQLLGDVFG